MLYIEQCLRPTESWRHNSTDLWLTRYNKEVQPYWADKAARLADEYLICPDQFADCLRQTNVLAQYSILELLAQPTFGVGMDAYVSGHLLADLLEHYYMSPQNPIAKKKRVLFEEHKWLLDVPEKTKYECVSQFVDRAEPHVLTAEPNVYLQYLVKKYPLGKNTITPVQIKKLESLGILLPYTSERPQFLFNGNGYSFSS